MVPAFARRKGVFVALSFGAFIASSFSQSARSVSRGVDVVEQWDGKRQLFTKGNIGVGTDGLDRLEAWLAKEAPNWTVAILANAGSETYRASDGRSYSGMDAVEYSLGQGLPATTSFAELRDKRTGEKNGAIFVIFLKERKFWYSASEVFDRRGLGEDRWVGHLDRPAFRAMSNGGRVLDAVTGTVTEIESQLSRQILLEQRRRERAALDAQRRRAQAQATVEQAAMDVEQLAKAAETFRAAHETAIGDLANPRVLHWRAQAKSAADLHAAERDAEAVRIAVQVSDFVRAHAGALAKYPEAPLKFEDLNRAIAELNPDQDGWGAVQLAEARDALARAQAAHARGESEYDDHFRAAEAAYYSAHEEIARARAEQQRRLTAQRELNEAAARKARMLRNTAVGGSAALGVGTLGLGLLMARRRRPFRKEAGESLTQWRLKFADQTDRLFGLLDRASVVVGSEEELDGRGYTGDTERLARESIRDVDSLFIMSSSVDRVLEQSEELITPSEIFPKIYNRFGTARFRKASALLKDEPIIFRQGDGVRPLRRNDGGDDGRPLGRLDSHDAFALTFEQLVEQFGDRADEAKQKLDVIERSWAEIDGALERAQADVDRAADTVSEIRRASFSDGLFPVPALNDVLLPAAQQHLDSAIEIGRTDPVGALAGPLPESLQRSSDASALAGVIAATRDQRLPELDRGVTQLKELGRSVQWVRRFLIEYSAQAEELAKLAVAGPSSRMGIDELNTDLGQLVQDATKAIELNLRAKDQIDKQITTADDAVEKARHDFTVELKIPPAELFNESGLIPGERLTRAREQRDAAITALDRGGVLAAEAALAEAASLTAEAVGLVTVTRRSFEEHATFAQQLLEENTHLENQLPEHDKLIAEMQAEFAPSALFDGAGTASTDPDVSIADLQKVARTSLADACSGERRAGELRSAGKLIAAAAVLAENGDLQYRARALMVEVKDHERRLRAAVRNNAVLTEHLDHQRRSLELTMDDMRTRRSTVEGFETASRNLLVTARGLVAPQPDPFAAAIELSAVEEAIKRCGLQAENDRSLYDEAVRSLGDASSQVAVSKRLGHQAAKDNIPDSRRTLELQEEVEKLQLAERAAERRIKVPHEDWSELDLEIDRVAAAGGRVAAELRGELERAQAAVASMRSAATAVRDANGWVGDYGVTVTGAPGADALHRAREFLMRGRYLETKRLAHDAQRQAKHAIALARSEVARQRRLSRMRAEEARRRREAARRRRSESTSSFGSISSGSSSSSGGFGGGGFGGGSSGSSGGSRSSFSSGSGGARSGW